MCLNEPRRIQFEYAITSLPCTIGRTLEGAWQACLEAGSSSLLISANSRNRLLLVRKGASAAITHSLMQSCRRSVHQLNMHFEGPIGIAALLAMLCDRVADWQSVVQGDVGLEVCWSEQTPQNSGLQHSFQTVLATASDSRHHYKNVSTANGSSSSSSSSNRL